MAVGALNVPHSLLVRSLWSHLACPVRPDGGAQRLPIRSIFDVESSFSQLKLNGENMVPVNGVITESTLDVLDVEEDYGE